MKFDYSDKNDKRVVESSPYALDYPKDIDKAPNKAGLSGVRSCFVHRIWNSGDRIHI
jgi:hypothetical protein